MGSILSGCFYAQVVIPLILKTSHVPVDLISRKFMVYFMRPVWTVPLDIHTTQLQFGSAQLQQQYILRSCNTAENHFPCDTCFVRALLDWRPCKSSAMLLHWMQGEHGIIKTGNREENQIYCSRLKKSCNFALADHQSNPKNPADCKQNPVWESEGRAAVVEKTARSNPSGLVHHKDHSYSVCSSILLDLTPAFEAKWGNSEREILLGAICSAASSIPKMEMKPKEAAGEKVELGFHLLTPFLRNLFCFCLLLATSFGLKPEKKSEQHIKSFNDLDHWSGPKDGIVLGRLKRWYVRILWLIAECRIGCRKWKYLHALKKPI